MGWLPPNKFFTDTLAHFTVAVCDEKKQRFNNLGSSWLWVFPSRPFRRPFRTIFSTTRPSPKQRFQKTTFWRTTFRRRRRPWRQIKSTIRRREGVEEREKLTGKYNSGWKPTHLTSIYPTDICLPPDGTMLTALIQMLNTDVCGC